MSSAVQCSVVQYDAQLCAAFCWAVFGVTVVLNSQIPHVGLSLSDVPASMSARACHVGDVVPANARSAQALASSDAPWPPRHLKASPDRRA